MTESQSAGCIHRYLWLTIVSIIDRSKLDPPNSGAPHPVTKNLRATLGTKLLRNHVLTILFMLIRVCNARLDDKILLFYQSIGGEAGAGHFSTIISMTIRDPNRLTYHLISHCSAQASDSVFTHQTLLFS